MKKKINISLGKTYSPKKRNISLSVNGVDGAHWKAWESDCKYFFEFDAGHLVTTFKVVEISKEEYLLLRSGQLDDILLINKYAKL